MDRPPPIGNLGKTARFRRFTLERSRNLPAARNRGCRKLPGEPPTTLLRRARTFKSFFGVKMRYLCVHGHFYQPPRENPWLEAVELQDSAYPYHDWNDRITSESYGPNGSARILDNEGRIARLANNYSRISFNFGPTLLSWLEQHAPDTYRAL